MAGRVTESLTSYRESIWAPQGVIMGSGLGLGLFPEELLQDGDDAAGFGQVAVLRPGILQQHIPVPAALQKLAAAKQGVVTHLRLPHKTLQAVHVLDGLRRGPWWLMDRKKVDQKGKRSG